MPQDEHVTVNRTHFHEHYDHPISDGGDEKAASVSCLPEYTEQLPARGAIWLGRSDTGEEVSTDLEGVLDPQTPTATRDIRKKEKI